MYSCIHASAPDLPHSKTSDEVIDKTRKTKRFFTFLQLCKNEGGVTNRTAVTTALNLVRSCLEEGETSYKWDNRRKVWRFADWEESEIDDTVHRRSERIPVFVCQLLCGQRQDRASYTYLNPVFALLLWNNI